MTSSTNNNKPSIFNSLFWRISAVFLVLFIIIGSIYVYTISKSAELYYQETNQRLNSDLAEHIVHEVAPFVNGEVKQESIGEIMHHMMAINPAIEVYLLDTTGKILSYVAPHKKILLDTVCLIPIKKFIAGNEQKYIVGDDPRNIGVQKVFSAAGIEENGITTGYIYVVLASEEYETAMQFLFGSYILKIGLKTTLITFLSTLVIGLLLIWFLTKSLTVVMDSVKRFRDGDFKARINLRSKGELTQLADTFNEMAETISNNIEYKKSMEKLRSELIANVSHDLRTPLSIIHGYIETLLMKRDTINADDNTRYLTNALNSTEKLKKLVAELFEFSKLESMQITPQKEPFSIVELAHEIESKYALIAKESGLSIKLNTPKGLSLVYADISLIERVLQNLIDNAIKFTPEGGTVNIKLTEKNNAVEVSVSDTGRGIPEKELPFIFDRYHKSANANSKSNDGVGLGLSIVKKILEIHNSIINVTSKKDQGTSFLFELPLYSQGV